MNPTTTTRPSAAQPDASRAHANPLATMPSDLDEQLAALSALVSDLEDALAGEAAALTSRDIEPLLSAVETKRNCLRALDSAWQRVGQTTPELVEPLREHLAEHLGRCRNLNDAVGGTIATLQRYAGESLKLLGASREPAAYSASGRATPDPATRKIAVG